MKKNHPDLSIDLLILSMAAFFFLAAAPYVNAHQCNPGQKWDSSLSQCITPNSAVLVSGAGTRSTIDQSGGVTTTGSSVLRSDESNASANLNGAFSSGTNSAGVTSGLNTPFRTITGANPNEATLAGGANAANPFATGSQLNTNALRRTPGYHTTDANARTNVNGTFSSGTTIDDAPVSQINQITTLPTNAVSRSFGGVGEPGTSAGSPSSSGSVSAGSGTLSGGTGVSASGSSSSGSGASAGSSGSAGAGTPGGGV